MSDHRLLDRWFEPVRVPLDAQHELSDLVKRGSVVFVMRSAGVLNFLFMAWLIRRWRLPVLRAALGLTGFFPWLARVRSSQTDLERAVTQGDTALVFLGRASGPDPFPLLVSLQRRLDRPILLVPALLVWTRRPQKLKGTLGEVLFGTPDVPSRFANAIGFVLNNHRAVLRVGQASDLAAFAADRTGQSAAVLGRKVRGALHLHLAQQVRAIVGPRLKSAARVRDQVLRDKGLRATLEQLARDSGRPLAELQGEAERDLREIASRYSAAFIEVLRPIAGWILHRLYDAIDVDEEGLARVKRASAEAPIVLCPSHKSHIDYLLLSWLFYENGMTPPHVAAGINLSFWPFGSIARRAGAFFIRRTLRGDRVYTATLRAYVKQLLRDRFPQEFYPEGGRSRSGKLLFPKTGIFSMEVDAWLDEAAHDVLFVPIAIDYEQLMEGRSYARELAGGEKTKEDVGELLKASKVLRRRYGRLTVQFDEPISLRAFAQERLGERAQFLQLDDDAHEGGGPGESTSAADKRQLVQALANRVAYGINRAATVTPVGLVAAAVLAHLQRGLSAGELQRRIELLRYVARERGARFARGLAGAPSTPLQPGPVADAIARLSAEGLLRVEQAAGEPIYPPVEERRPLLDFHRNAVIHRYVPMALVSLALGAATRAVPAGEIPTVEDVKERTRWLSRLLKLEFMYRVGSSHDEVFEETVQFLGRVDAVRRTGDRIGVGADPSVVPFLSALVRPYLEAYQQTFEALLALDLSDPNAGFDRRALVKAALEQGRAAYAAGRIAMREAISKVTFENAAEWLFQQGALAPGEAGRSRLSASWREKKLPEFLQELQVTLGA